MKLFLISENGKLVPQKIQNIRECAVSYPFQIECLKPNSDMIKPGSVIKIIGYHLGKYKTSDGSLIQGQDTAWTLVA